MRFLKKKKIVFKKNLNNYKKGKKYNGILNLN